MDYAVQSSKTLNKEKNIKKIKPGRIVLYVFLILLAVICLLPFYIMIISATHTSEEIATQFLILPGSAFIDNYVRMIQSVQYFWNSYKNSLVVSISATALAGYFGSLAAYGFAKYKFKGNNLLFWLVLCSMMVPLQIGLLGFFKVVQASHFLVNSHLALIIPAMGNACLVFFVKLYIETAVPDSIIESARIDGCGEYKIFNKIVIPMIMPSIATMSIFTFISTWNNFLTPLIVLYDEKKYTVPLMTAMAKGVYRTDFGAVYVTIALAVVPIMIVFAFCSKYIIGGLAAGAVKE
jgi:multiple sugar transport system permease protein